MKQMDVENSIPLALGISKEWEDKNEAEIIQLIENEKLISDALLKHAINIKKSEFGEDIPSTITDYEKKLIWSGMEITKLILFMKNIKENDERIRKLKY